MAISETQRRVHDYVRICAQQGTKPTISQAAKDTGIPRSTVARVASSLGYDGWLDFTEQMAHYYASGIDEERGVVNDSAQIIADALLERRGFPVLVDGVGDAEICVSYLTLRLSELGMMAMPFSDGFFDARPARMQGVLIVFNESGMTLLPACVTANEHGFEVIAVTASHDTPVSKVAEVNIVIKNRKSVPQSYEPNYFAAGSIALFERVLAICSRELQRTLRVTATNR